MRPPRTLLAPFHVFERFHSPILFIHFNRCHNVQYRLHPCSIVDGRPCYRAEILSQASTASFSLLVWLASIWWAVSRGRKFYRVVSLWHLLSICTYLSHFGSIRQPTTSQVCAALYSQSSWHILSLCAPQQCWSSVFVASHHFIIRSFHQSSNRISSLEGCVLPDGLNELQLVRCSCIMNGIQSLFSNPTVMLAHQDENDISLIDAHTFPFSKELSLLKLVNQPQFHFYC